MHKAKILVIDDDPEIRILFRSFLGRVGLEVITADDGVTGLEAYCDHAPDLVITDIQMPSKNGLEVIVEIKDLCPEQIVLAIATMGGGLLEEAAIRGADDVLQKPFSAAELLRKIERWLPT